MSTPLPPFIDTVHAAELLRVSPDEVLDWVAEGKLRPFGGKSSNPILRSTDVQALIQELGINLEESPPKRVKSASARVQARLTADSRWSEIGEDEILEWARRAEPARRQAAARTVKTAHEKLQIVLRTLGEPDPDSPSSAHE
jgi:hypothetical protein